MIESWRRHYNTERPHSSLGIDRRHQRPSSGTPKGDRQNALAKLTSQSDHPLGASQYGPLLERRCETFILLS